MGVWDRVKEIFGVITKVRDIDLYRKTTELQREVDELTQSKRGLKARVEELEGQLRFSKKLSFKKPVYYAEGDPVPYCPRCWEVEKQAVHLIVEPWGDGETRYECQSCGRVIVE